MKKMATITIFACFFSISTIFSTNLIKEKYNNYKLYNGTFTNTAITEGKIILSHELKYYPSPEENLIFSIDVLPDGTMYVGTGHNGALYKVNLKKSELIYRFKKPDIFSLTSDKKGNLYVATSPMGKVYILKKGEKKPSEFFNPQERFIWDMKIYKNKLYIATGGNGGKLYIVSLKNGSKIKEFSFDELNIVKIFIDKDGNIFLGGGEKGILYTIKDKPFSVFSSKSREIKGIYYDPLKNFFYLSSNGKESFSLKSSKEKKTPELSYQKSGYSRFLVLRKNFTNLITNYIKGNTYDLAYQYSKVWVLTDDKGKVYSFKIVKNEDEWKTTKTLEFLLKGIIGFKLLSKNGKLFGIQNFPAGIFEIKNKRNSSGEFVSDIIDFNANTNILSFSATTNSVGDVFVSFRGGNSSSPQSDWSEWSPPILLKGTSTIKVGIKNVRYFQFKLQLKASLDGRTPEVSDFYISYKRENFPPVIKKVNFKGEKENSEKSYELSWDAEDSNKGDEVIFDLYYMCWGCKEWVAIKRNFKENKFNLLKENFPEGEFKFKITAKDTLSNPKSEAKKSSFETKFYTIDFTPPHIINFSSKNGKITFTIIDSVSPVKKVLIKTKMDGNWKYIEPEDKIYDSKKENFTLDIKSFLIYIKVEDVKGNKAVYFKRVRK